MKIEVMGYEAITKTVKPASENISRVYLPKRWVGKKVKIIQIDEIEDEDEEQDALCQINTIITCPRRSDLVMNKAQKEAVLNDFYRYYGREITLKEKFMMFFGYSREIKYMILVRKYQFSKNKFGKLWWYFRVVSLSRKTHIQIPVSTKIGKGFYIGHCGRIIINPKAVLGNNINIATGVTIGQESRGKRKGYPTIGNEVWIGTNAVIVGNITIGDDVLIAPNAYVNRDIPSHSIVIGNPATIHPRDNATIDYINNKV